MDTLFEAFYNIRQQMGDFVHKIEVSGFFMQTYIGYLKDKVPEFDQNKLYGRHYLFGTYITEHAALIDWWVIVHYTDGDVQLMNMQTGQKHQRVPSMDKLIKTDVHISEDWPPSVKVTRYFPEGIRPDFDSSEFLKSIFNASLY